MSSTNPVYTRNKSQTITLHIKKKSFNDIKYLKTFNNLHAKAWEIYLRINYILESISIVIYIIYRPKF